MAGPFAPDGAFHGHFQRTQPDPSALTLIELLVVIAIIAILSALLLPALFIDGELSGDFPFTGTAEDPKPGTRRVDIGVDDQDVGWFPGTIDEIRIYDRTLPKPVGSIPIDALSGLHAISALAVAAAVTGAIFQSETTLQNHCQK
jgi:prepilin-type N-terminal cleavage/methylation domain-containing protein